MRVKLPLYTTQQTNKAAVTKMRRESSRYRYTLSTAGFGRLPEATGHSNQKGQDEACGWCNETFNNLHSRVTTACCGFTVGDACLEDIYDEDDTCWNCSARRPDSSSVETSIHNGPVHIERFIGKTQTPANVLGADHASNLDVESISRLQITDSDDASSKTSLEEALQTPGVPLPFPSLTQALEMFLNLWATHNDKLSQQERHGIVDRTQRALAGKSFT